MSDFSDISAGTTGKRNSAPRPCRLHKSFRYCRELYGEHDAVLEFELELDGIAVNGVDMIRWNAQGRITEFKVMLRPLKAVTLIHEKMAAMLQAARR